MRKILTRRRVLIGGGLAAGGLAAANWQALATAETYDPLLRVGESFGMHTQRLLMPHRPLAREYRRDQLSANHPSTGGIGASYVDPNPTYHAMAQRGFRDWRLAVGGLVRHPLSLTLGEIVSMPSRTQVTMHSCDEGWSAIGEWRGVQLRRIVELVGALPQARYVVFRCMDTIGGERVWGSIDLLDAIHPQTLLAYAMNGEALPIRHGAPLRLRIELQIGYKNLKHINSIELVESLDAIDGGMGGLFEKFGYQWYAGQ